MPRPRLGLIGTGAISAEFVAAVSSENAFEIAALMSRSQETATRFARETGLGQVAIATGIEELVSLDLDAVYIASPNSLHYEHALAAIGRGLDVIVEKPAFWNPHQWQDVHAAATEAGVLVLEAARHIFEPGFMAVTEWASTQTLTGATLNFHQYSSRWDAVVAGQEPNIFSLEHGGGALVDLGIYAVYAAVAWFGEPEGVLYRPQLAPTGVDAGGVLLLSYPGFTAELAFSKNQTSSLPSEVRAGKKVLHMNAVQGIDLVQTLEGETLYRAQAPRRALHELMRYEVVAFSRLITASRAGTITDDDPALYRQLTALSQTVNRICTDARLSAGIIFTGECA